MNREPYVVRMTRAPENYRLAVSCLLAYAAAVVSAASAIASVQFADAALCLAMMRATPREREWRDVVDGDGDE